MRGGVVMGSERVGGRSLRAAWSEIARLSAISCVANTLLFVRLFVLFFPSTAIFESVFVGIRFVPEKAVKGQRLQAFFQRMISI